MQTYEVRLARHPDAVVTAQDFTLAETRLPARIPEDTVLVRNVCFGLNAGMRARLGARAAGAGVGEPAASRFGAFLQPGDVPRSDAVARVVASASPRYQVGDMVVHMAPWRLFDVVADGGLRGVDVSAEVPAQMYLTAFGHPAFTAYVGMTRIGAVRPDDTVYVSAAAGGVGGFAVQIARAFGARVIGSAGGADKLAYLRDELRLDAAFDYRRQQPGRALAELAPDGISLFYDNVGGAQLEQVIGAMCQHGRIVLCGAVAQTTSGLEPVGPRNLHLFIRRNLSMRGFMVHEHESMRAAFERQMRMWVRAGTVKHRPTVLEGFETLPQAFAGLLQGDNTGRMIVSC